jgi:hypothetical protein
MVKFKITGARIAEACNVAEYLLLSAGNTEMVIRIAPRFVVDDNDEYIVKIILDEDGDIASYDGMSTAFERMAKVTPKRLEKMAKEFSEAVKNIVNPQSGAA